MVKLYRGEARDITIKEHRWQREKEVLERKYKLKQEKILGSATITKIFKNNGLNGESIDMKVLDKMCKLLDCQPGDLLECVKDLEGYSDTSERGAKK